MRCLPVLVVAACGFRASGGPALDTGPGADAAGSIDAAGCPAGYVQLAGLPSRYRLSGGSGPIGDPLARGTWVMAEADCADDGVGTHLAIAETQAEHEAFVDVVSGASRWLGVTDRKSEGTWRTITGGTTFFALWSSPPQDTGSDCLILTRVPSHEGSFCDDPDPQWHKGYICECDGVAVDPTAF
jgi:hypothetical protein